MEGESYLLKLGTLKISAFSSREPASGAQGLDQMRWDQASRGPFGHVYLQYYCCWILKN